MNTSHISSKSVSLALAAAISLTLGGPVFGQATAREKAQVILEDVKKRDLESQLAIKQIELKRLNEDLQKRQNEGDALQLSINAISSALAETNESLDQLLARKKHLTRVLELTTQRIDAERLKMDGLKSLSDAQAKAQDRVAKQVDETTIRANIGGAEFRILSQRQTPAEGEPASKDDAVKLLSEITDLKKKLDKSERNTALAVKTAREAIASATERLSQADASGAKAKKMAEEWGLTDDGDVADDKPAPPDPVGEAPVEKKN